MAIKLSQVFGKYKPAKPRKPALQPGPVPARPPGNVRQDRPATSPPSTGAGGQGPVQSTPVVQPPTGPDTSWQDSTYNNTHSTIQTGLGNLKGYLTNAGNDLGLDYGVSFDRNPDDPLQGSNFRIDPNVDVTNPFSRAALLNRTHKQNMAGNTNSYAARGQLYAGSLQNAQDTEGFGYLAGQNALKTDFASKFGGLYKQWLDAQQAGSQADIDAIAAAQERHKNDPAAETGYNTGGAAAAGTNPSQYADSSVGGRQPGEPVSQAVKDYLRKQKKPVKPGRTKPPKKGSGRTGGARAPGGK